MPPPVDADPRRRWIETALAPETCTRIARSILDEAERRRLNLRFAGFESWKTAEPEDICRAVCQELVVFLLEAPGLLDQIVHAPRSRGEALLKRAFLNHWSDRSRQLAADPRKSLRKFCMDRIRDSGRFHYDAQAQDGPRFARAATAVPVSSFPDEDRRDIPYPADAKGGTEEAVRKRAIILSLAEHFLARAAVLFDVPEPSVRLDDFVCWLEDHLEFPTVDPESLDDTRFGPGEPADSRVFGPSMEQIARWADMFAAGLTDEEARLLRRRYDEGLSLEAMAERMGRKSPSTPKYRLDRLHGRIAAFRREHLPDDDDGTARIFGELLLERLKNPEPKP